MTEPKDDPKMKFNKKWLAGLTFSGTELKEVKTESGKETVRVPFERELTETDVIDFKVYGHYVALVTADGRKHQVKTD